MGTQTVQAAARPVRAQAHGRLIVDWLTTTDHKKIGHLHLITSFAFFLVGGVMALLMRAELARPGLQIMDNNQFNQLFTMHGTIMLLLFATPMFAGFANEPPLQIGSPDVAFPRPNVPPRGGRGRRPLGLRPLPGVGGLLPAAPAQLQEAAEDPLRVPCVRPAPPGVRGYP